VEKKKTCNKYSASTGEFIVDILEVCCYSVRWLLWFKCFNLWPGDRFI